LTGDDPSHLLPPEPRRERMDAVESLILFAVYVVVIAAIAMLTPRIGNGIAALASVLRRRKHGQRELFEP